MINKLIFAGHSAVFFEIDGYNLVIDPWLQGNPLCPSNLKQPKKIDAIVLTHGHSDHAGEAAEIARLSGAKLLATYELAMLMVKAGVPEEQVIPMNKGGSINLGIITVALTHAMHSNSFDSTNGTCYAGEACGVIIKYRDSTIYHAGDTALFSDLRLISECYQPQIALLPIGDRFTMGPRDAAKAAALVAAKKVIPIHYNTFPLLTGTSTEFETELAVHAPEVELVVLDPGQSLDIF